MTDVEKPAEVQPDFREVYEATRDGIRWLMFNESWRMLATERDACLLLIPVLDRLIQHGGKADA